MALKDVVWFGSHLIEPTPQFFLVWDVPKEPKRSPEERQWWHEAQAEVDAICTALKDWVPRA